METEGWYSKGQAATEEVLLDNEKVMGYLADKYPEIESYFHRERCLWYRVYHDQGLLAPETAESLVRENMRHRCIARRIAPGTWNVMVSIIPTMHTNPVTFSFPVSDTAMESFKPV